MNGYVLLLGLLVGAGAVLASPGRSMAPPPTASKGPFKVGIGVPPKSRAAAVPTSMMVDWSAVTVLPGGAVTVQLAYASPGSRARPVERAVAMVAGGSSLVDGVTGQIVYVAAPNRSDAFSKALADLAAATSAVVKACATSGDCNY